MRMQHTKLAASNLSTDSPERATAKATIVAEVERLHWRIWNGKAKNARRSIKRIRKVMHVFKGEHSQGVKGVASRKLWHALHAVDINISVTTQVAYLPSILDMLGRKDRPPRFRGQLVVPGQIAIDSG
jgi:hypothetical protein